MCGSFLAGNELGAMEETCRALYILYFGGMGGRRGQFRLAPRQQDFHPLVVRATANASCACVGDGCACGGGRAAAGWTAGGRDSAPSNLFSGCCSAGSVVIMGFLVVDVVSRLDPYTILWD